VIHHGPVPVRWLAPESLMRGVYNVKTMVYSLGCIMAEVLTYGCQPFSSLDDPQSRASNTENIVKMVSSIKNL
jgi:serine/threonine protein kinase